MNHYDAPPPMLCPVCMDEYIAHWEDMWAEYYYGQGFRAPRRAEAEATDVDLLKFRVSNFEVFFPRKVAK